jgi:hypothetical protein
MNPSSYSRPPAPRRESSGGFIEDHAGWIAASSAVLGVVGLFALPILASIAAIVLGSMARRAIDRTGRNLDQRSWATVGIWTGWIGALLGVVLVLLFVFGVIGAFALFM